MYQNNNFRKSQISISQAKASQAQAKRRRQIAKIILSVVVLIGIVTFLFSGIKSLSQAMPDFFNANFKDKKESSKENHKRNFEEIEEDSFASFNIASSAQTSNSPPPSLIQNSSARNAIWSISIRNSQGAEIYAYNSGLRLTPASNLKLLTSAAVIDSLGADYQFETQIYGMGELKDTGVWDGDIYILGAGDPSISGAFFGGEKFAVFKEFTKQLKERGIQSITGRVIGNDSLFENTDRIPQTWHWEDLSYYYASEISALSFNDNCIDLEVKAQGRIGEKPQISWFPFNTDYIDLVNEQIITSRKEAYEEHYQRELGINRIILRSHLPQGYKEGESLTISNPALFFVDSFTKFAIQDGIKITKKPRLNHEFQDFKGTGFNLLASHKSPMLKDLLKRVNKHSDNFYTETLLRAAAAEKYGKNNKISAREKDGIQLIKTYACAHGFDCNQLVIHDGAGLSSENFISTTEMTQLLLKSKDQSENGLGNNFAAFKDSLSIAGIDGTLQGRFGKSPLIGKIKGKSGYVEGVIALSGYLENKAGEELTFSLITNHFPNSQKNEIRSIQNKILERAYEGNL
ncbi:MAG: D-alanyl-D-alanine carboxypeptidase/D-alanyl-D-alanine-endopeptidase [Candidatus Melainabacteria bacterium]|jgi:D-alanyl-D-alanine carboxypeptidase/D-alanyl-D-alanine-endopeptidase (penicillin-binding protein 4)